MCIGNLKNLKRLGFTTWSIQATTFGRGRKQPCESYNGFVTRMYKKVRV